MPIFNSLGSNYDGRFLRRSLWASPSDSVAKLETYLKRHYKTSEVQLTYKGREAITLALKSLNLAAGARVAVNGYTCYAVFQAITSAGMKPYYLDIDKDDFNFTAATLKKALSQEPEIKAVMIQNTLGIPCDIEGISKICSGKGLPLIEDLAHSVGMKYENGKEAGTIGDAVALSFSQDKMADGVSGGALIMNRGNIAEVSPKQVELSEKFKDHIYPITTAIIRDTFGIYIGRVLLKVMKSLNLLSRPMEGHPEKTRIMRNYHAKLTKLSFDNLGSTIAHRKRIAEIYRKNIDKSLQVKQKKNSTYLRFPIKTLKRDQLIEHLKQYGINISDVWYDAPIGPKYTMDDSDYAGQCPLSEGVSLEMLNLPTHIHVRQQDAEMIGERINQWLKSQ